MDNRKQAKIYFIIALIFAGIIIVKLSSCTKPQDNVLPEKCKYYHLVSDKYNSDSIFVRRDTLWQDEVCGKWIDSIENAKDMWIFVCETGYIEHWYYIRKR